MSVGIMVKFLGGANSLERETLMQQNLSSLCVGQIRSPHGLSGATRISSYTEEPKALFEFSSFVDEHGSPLLSISHLLFEENPRTFVVMIAGVSNRESAENLKGQKLYILKEQLPSLKEDSFYHADLVGLQVLREDQAPFGMVRAVDNFGAGDLLEIVPVDVHLAPFWLPFREAFVPEVSLSKGYICIRLDESMVTPAKDKEPS